jgi:hypothetical protein
MIRIDSDYTLYRRDDDPFFPGGKAVPAPTGNSIAGTPWRASWFNTILGFFQAAIVDAKGELIVSGQPDQVGDSDILSALKIISERITDTLVNSAFILQRLKTVDGIESGLDADLLGGHTPDYYLNSGIGFFVKAVYGIETVIPLNELNIEFNPSKQYPVFVSAGGDYPEFVSFNAELLSDGLHIRPVRLIGGELVKGTRMKKWGQGKWGTGRVYVSGKKWGDGKWGNGKWSANRWLAGDLWGAYAPMNVNIIFKEA